MDDATVDRLRRRLLGGLATASLLATPLARAQSPKRLVIADPHPSSIPAASGDLAKLGFVEGKNLRIDQVPLRGSPPELAEDRARAVIALRPDVVLMLFSAETVLLRLLAPDIPIVFFNCPSDPVRGGLMASAARPGGNVTGTYHDYFPLIVKRWALFREIKPSLKRGAWIGTEENHEPPRWSNREAANAYAKGFLWQEREAHAVAQRELGIRIVEIVLPRGATEEQMVAAVRRERPEAIRMAADSSEGGAFERFLVAERILWDLVARVSSDSLEGWRAAIPMVARILRGEPPATIPAFQGTRYTVKVNPRLAKEMGITLPQSVLLQAGVLEK